MTISRKHKAIFLLTNKLKNNLELCAYFQKHTLPQNPSSKQVLRPNRLDQLPIGDIFSKQPYNTRFHFYLSSSPNSYYQRFSSAPSLKRLSPFYRESSVYWKTFLKLRFRMFATKNSDTDDEKRVTIDLSEDRDLIFFIQSGLIYKKLYSSSLSPSSSSSESRILTIDEFSIEEWKGLGARIYQYLYSSTDVLSESVLNTTKLIDLDKARRIYHLYIPLIKWCKANLVYHKNRTASGPQNNNENQGRQALVIGIHAPQGCGKTTLCDVLVHFLSQDKLNIASLSIDDFYLTHEKQRKLSQENSNNPLLQCRGNAGTHDIELGESTLKTLKYSTSMNLCKLPRYDKSQFGGQGDRAQESTWPEIQTPVDLVLLEGWMLGFKTLSDLPKEGQKNIGVINCFMCEYERWYELIDAWITIKVANIEQVYQWRMEAEKKMIASVKDGMTEEQVMDFVGRYMPAYETYLPTLYEEQWHQKETGDILPQISFVVENNRLPPLDTEK